jgi:hypothetical protein
MGKGYILDKDVIVISRDLTDLDLFVKKFIDVLKKHADYLIVSGYVSISTGRIRGTEDIDVLVPVLNKDVFKNLFYDLEKNGFWCYQGDDYKEAYLYFKDMKNIRFAEVNKIFPNIEFVPINEKRKAKFFEFNHPQKVRVKDFEFKISPIEFEILYKEIILASKKDLSDARHLRTFFSNLIKEEKFKEYEHIIKSELK